MQKMSSTTNIIKTNRQTLPWSLWARQIGAIFRLEIKKNFLGKRSILIYLLALLPLLPLALLALFTPSGREWNDFTQYSMIYAVYYGGLILRTIVFFGCAWIFMNLFRGEVVDRSLHYYFLSPLRREVLVVAKYLSGLLTALILFVSATAVSVLLLYLPLGMQHLSIYRRALPLSGQFSPASEGAHPSSAARLRKRIAEEK